MTICRLTISGPGPNAMSHETVRELRAAIAEAGDRPLLLTGQGRAFSAGLDLKALVKMSVDDFGAFLEDLEALGRELFLHPAPTIASINGHCVAGGYLLAACCEYRIAPAEDRVRFGLPAVRLGLQYPPSILNALRFALDRRAADEILLGAESFGAYRALELGMVDELVDDVEAASIAWLEQRAALPAEAYAATKRSLRLNYATVSDEEARRFRDDVIPSWADPERIQRMMEALGK